MAKSKHKSPKTNTTKLNTLDRIAITIVFMQLFTLLVMQRSDGFLEGIEIYAVTALVTILYGIYALIKHRTFFATNTLVRLAPLFALFYMAIGTLKQIVLW